MPRSSLLRCWLLGLLVWLLPLLAHGQAAGQSAPAAGGSVSADDRTVTREAYDKGKRAFEAGDFPAAHESFKLAHGLIPTPHTQYWMALCLDRLGKRKEALAEYEKFLADPQRSSAGTDRVTTAEARVAALAVEVGDAKQVARQEYDAGRQALQSGNHERALTHFEKAHGLIPTAHTQYWMAFCLDQLGRKPEALAAYRTFLARPDHASAGDERGGAARARVRTLDPGQPEPAALGPPRIVAGASAEVGTPTVMALRPLSRAIDDLESEIRQSQHQLRLVTDAVMAQGSSSGQAQIRFVNDLGGAFRITEVLFVLDGTVQYQRRDTSGSLAKQTEIPVFTGSIKPGQHTVQVLLKLQGHGYGVFSYLRGYSFEVKSTHSFEVQAGKTVQLDAVAWERGGASAPMDQRPALRFTQQVTSGYGGPAAAPPPSAAAGR